LGARPAKKGKFRQSRAPGDDDERAAGTKSRRYHRAVMADPPAPRADQSVVNDGAHDAATGSTRPSADPLHRDTAACAATDRPDDVGRVGTMRGASVELDRRRLAQLLRVAIAGVVATLAVLAIVLTVAANRSNDRIEELQDQGVPVTLTVTGCLGLLGGSGTNPVGYSCHAAYVLDGHRYTETLPGLAARRPGTRIAAVAVPADPSLVSPAATLKDEHASAGAFAVPIALGAALAVLLAVLVVRARSGERSGRTVARSHSVSTV
jgi:hypothetical protein